ncbi:hypothetical protein B0H13DRAFT_759008 [Mycena leptocephala]|nr:hypothetical protein B0H13DRAFT_759008 [Mycena leptocephala]
MVMVMVVASGTTRSELRRRGCGRRLVGPRLGLGCMPPLLASLARTHACAYSGRYTYTCGVDINIRHTVRLRYGFGTAPAAAPFLPPSSFQLPAIYGLADSAISRTDRPQMLNRHNDATYEARPASCRSRTRCPPYLYFLGTIHAQATLPISKPASDPQRPRRLLVMCLCCRRGVGRLSSTDTRRVLRASWIRSAKRRDLHCRIWIFKIRNKTGSLDCQY